MGIDASDFRTLIIRPILEQIGDWSQSAENLLLGTAAQESRFGLNVTSNKASRLGIYQISADTHLDVWDNFLAKFPELASNIRGLASQQRFLKFPHDELILNLGYATGIAWMIYKRHHLALADNLQPHELAQYWLNYYCSRDTPKNQNEPSNIANTDEFASCYCAFILPEKKHLAA